MSSRTLLGCIELGLLAGIAVLTFAATAGSQAATGVSRFAADPPAPPGKPVVLEKGLNTLSVTWTALDEAVGDATSHDFEYRQGTSGDWIAGPQGLRGTGAELGSLATDTDYQVRMRARNAAGHSDWSEPGEGRTALWAARLTVGSAGSIDKWWGYEHREKYPKIGRLVPSAFDDGTTETRIVVLTWFRGNRTDPVGSHTSALDLYTQDHAIPDSWTLRVGSLRFPVAEGYLASFPDLGQEKVFWRHPDIAWSIGETHDIALYKAFGSQTMLHLVPELTARFESLPDSHDGSTPFEFRLRFSRDVETSYSSFTDSVFDVAGGAVIGARRLNPPSSIAWILTLQPEGSGDVSIDLPASRACDADGAVCTASWKMLAAAIETKIPARRTRNLSITGFTNRAVGENEVFTSSVPSLTGTPYGDVAWTLTGADAGDFTIDASTGVVSMAPRDYERPVDADADNRYEARVTATDEGGNRATASFAVTVNDAIETAAVSISGLSDAATYENVSWTSAAPSASGAIGPVTWSASGEDADAFRIDAVTGVLTLPAQDYEAPADADRNNDYVVTVRATDADGNADAVSIAVTVLDSAETARVTIEGLADDATPENVTWTSPTPSVSGAIGSVHWTKEGPDANEFELDDSGGVLTLSTPDYETPTDADADNAYEVTVKAVDTDGNAGERSLEVKVMDVPETAVLTVTGLFSVSVAENRPWSSSVPAVSGAIGAVTWTRHGEDAGDFTIDTNTGVLTLPAQDYESPRDADRDNTYRVTAKATDADDNEGEESIEVAVTDVDDGGTGTGTGTGTGGSGGGGGSTNRPPVVEKQIAPQTLAAGETLELDISRNFYDRDQRALDYFVESANPGVAAVEVDRQGVLTLRGIARGMSAVTVTAADRRDERVSQTFVVTVRGPALVPLVPRASGAGWEGFVRVINRSGEGGEVSIEAIDDRGTSAGTVMLTIGADAVAHFNSADLEQGNPAKGLSGGVGSGKGDWRLIVDSELEFEVLSYVRTADGFLTSMHDTAPKSDGVYEVAIFNPGSNPNQLSRLRLINLDAEEAEVTITGVDDAGASPGAVVEIVVPGGESVTLTSAELEAGTGVAGALGDGSGKWRLLVRSDQPILVMNLLSSPSGHLTNLSTAPGRSRDGALGRW